MHTSPMFKMEKMREYCSIKSMSEWDKWNYCNQRWWPWSVLWLAYVCLSIRGDNSRGRRDRPRQVPSLVPMKISLKYIFRTDKFCCCDKFCPLSNIKGQLEIFGLRSLDYSAKVYSKIKLTPEWIEYSKWNHQALHVLRGITEILWKVSWYGIVVIESLFHFCIFPR